MLVYVFSEHFRLNWSYKNGCEMWQLASAIGWVGGDLSLGLLFHGSASLVLLQTLAWNKVKSKSSSHCIPNRLGFIFVQMENVPSSFMSVVITMHFSACHITYWYHCKWMNDMSRDLSLLRLIDVNCLSLSLFVLS